MIRHPNLKGWWRQEGSGSDSSGSNFNATSAVGVTYAASVFGSGGVYAGTAITVLPALNITGATPRTIAAWIKPSSTGATNKWIFSMGVGTNTQFHFCLLSAKPSIHYNATTQSADQSCTLGQWNHVAVTFNGGTLNGTNVLFYINGKLCTSTYSGGTLNSSNSYFNLGNHPNGLWPISFADDVHLYNTALSISDIKRIMVGLHPLKKI